MRKAILCLIFFFSGVAALIFEDLWFQLLGLLLGNSVWATSIVLASFMAGLALGNSLVSFHGHKIRFPIRLFALLELTIGLSGVALVFLLPRLTELLVPVFRMALDHTSGLNSFRTILAFVLLVIPTTAMGATLPILVRALVQDDSNFGRALALLYGCNTLGAMVGVLANELFFVGWFGLQGAGIVALSCNLVVAMVALAVLRDSKTKNTEASKKPWKFSATAKRTLAASFLTGLSLLALEVIWFRFLLLFINAYSLNFAVMLAVVLAGISGGGFFAARWFRRNDQAESFLTPVLMISSIYIILAYNSFDLVYLVANPYKEAIVILSLFLMFPVSFISGIAFTMLGKLLHREIGDETASAGLLTLTNTLGAMLGSMLAVLVLLPLLGMEKSFFAIAIVYGIIAFVVVERGLFVVKQERKAPYYICVGLFVVCAVFFPFGLMEDVFLHIPYQRFSPYGEKRIYHHEDSLQTVQYLRREILDEPYYYRLVTNSHSMSSTTLRAKRYMKLYAYWPLAVRPQAKSALLICYGCGSTAKALTDSDNFTSIDIVEISKAVTETSSVIFPDKQDDPLHDPRVRLHIEDGRFFLMTTERKFDLITAEPPPPTYRGVASLYSQEYFQLIYDCLEEGGIATYWLPVSQLDAAQSKAILRGFCNVFPDASLWLGAGLEWMIVGIKSPQEAVSSQEFSRQWQNPQVAEEMRALGLLSPQQLGSLFIADGETLRDWCGDAPPLMDNYPHRLSYESQEDVVLYKKWMDRESSQNRFVNSPFIAKIWPKSMVKPSLKHFVVRNIINDIFIANEYRSHSQLLTLHQCIHNPLLKDYILQALESDIYIQRIMDRKREEVMGNPDLFLHLAAQAISRREYSLAAGYYRNISQLLPQKDPRQEKFYTYQIYLAFLTNNRPVARKITQQFMQIAPDEKARNRMAQRWQWLERTFE